MKNTSTCTGFNRFVWFLFSILLLAGCISSTPRFDNVAYTQAISIKLDTLALMDKAVDDYSQHRQEVEQLMRQIDKAYEYTQGRKNAELILEQWKIIRDPGENLVVGFFNRWKEKGRLNSDFIGGSKTNVSGAFNQIIELENGLIKAEQ